jgi:hypothetical protein
MYKIDTCDENAYENKKNTKALERHHLIWVCTGKDQAGSRGYILQISDKKNLRYSFVHPQLSE